MTKTWLQDLFVLCLHSLDPHSVLARTARLPRMPSSVNSGGAGGAMKISSLLMIISVIAILMFVALHSFTLSFMTPEPSSKLVASNHEEFKKLMDQTKLLLNDIAASNLPLSPNTLRDIEQLTNEEKLVGERNVAMEKEMNRLETGLARCSKAKYEAEASLSTCKADLNEATSKSISTLPVDCPPSNNVIVSSSSASAVNTDEKKWLVIGIPTVARRNNEDYLLKSLAAMADQLPLDPDDPLYHQILINVINMQANSDPRRAHVMFEKAKELYGSATSPYASYFRFSELQKNDITPDPRSGTNAQSDPGNANVPGYLVRRQTRNIAFVVQRSLHLGKYYLFLEDDMQLCAQGFLAIQYLLRKASRYHPHWLAIRASYGMNGIFMHDEDLDVFAKYLIKHQTRRPPDHLVVEWYAGETPEAAAHKRDRRNIGFKFNLFDHLGVVSTLRAQAQTSFPRCYELLMEPTVFQVEAYNARDCPRDDLWPCNHIERPDLALIDWSQLRQ